jgi:hypothetical protein
MLRARLEFNVINGRKPIFVYKNSILNKYSKKKICTGHIAAVQGPNKGAGDFAGPRLLN